jgi:hypothetical protein
MSFFPHCYVKYLTESCHNDIMRLVDVPSKRLKFSTNSAAKCSPLSNIENQQTKMTHYSTPKTTDSAKNNQLSRD